MNGMNVCQECGQWVGPGIVYHPYLYCVLWRAGIRDQEGFLRAAGWVRETAPSEGEQR